MKFKVWVNAIPLKIFKIQNDNLGNKANIIANFYRDFFKIMPSIFW